MHGASAGSMASAQSEKWLRYCLNAGFFSLSSGLHGSFPCYDVCKYVYVNSNSFVFLASPWKCPSGVAVDCFEAEFSRSHFMEDQMMMGFAASQRDLFSDGWLNYVVRVYWLKARLLALQVS